MSITECRQAWEAGFVSISNLGVLQRYAVSCTCLQRVRYREFLLGGALEAVSMHGVKR